MVAKGIDAAACMRSFRHTEALERTPTLPLWWSLCLHPQAHTAASNMPAPSAVGSQ